jgi:hypothetical protein
MTDTAEQLSKGDAARLTSSRLAMCRVNYLQGNKTARRLEMEKGRYLLPATLESNSQGGNNDATSCVIVCETRNKSKEKPQPVHLRPHLT